MLSVLMLGQWEKTNVGSPADVILIPKLHLPAALTATNVS